MKTEGTELSARQRLDAILTRLEERKATEAVYVKLYPDTARVEADAADQRAARGESLGPLDGKIVSIKDLFDVAGEPNLAGSIIRKTAEPAGKDAVIVERLRKAGAIIIGKTHMTEFAFTAVGLNPHYPVPGNAYDARLVAGGSSSGAAVSAGEGTCDIAIGSDTGGSVRIPAALNGVVGFKPTHGRVSLEGAFPLSPTLDSVGPLAKTVAACADADAIMAGEAPLPLEKIDLAGLKVGIAQGIVLQDMEEDVAAAYQSVLKKLEAAGAVFTECSFDTLINTLRTGPNKGSLTGIEAAHIHKEWLNDLSMPVDVRVSVPLRERLKIPASEYESLLAFRGELVKQADEMMSAFDVVVLPTTPVKAVPIAQVENDEPEYDRFETLYLRNTQIVNQFAMTALSIPMPMPGRPAGLMLVGRNGSDRKILAIGVAVEALLSA
ncbi:amidase [Ochrobactrum sp. SFR4]|uniref:amidase n=1 Tax=Ochrobactrum sp. SFR4 TaxID=2717368 RepID=UPI001C8B8EE8|nr:amidase [Ochrobactrum sp. SFR4]MBX8827285.1 amidase [Ochrobactrum sp. SFR4]